MKSLINLPKRIGLLLIKIYQKFFSLDQSFWEKNLGIRVCIHYPTCSEYTYQAIERFGLIRGCIMGFFRILRCNPFSRGGVDDVPDKFSIHRSKSN